MDDKFLIHVEIAGKSYGIRINRSEEQVAREAVRQIRMKMDQYREEIFRSGCKRFVSHGDLPAISGKFDIGG